MDDIKMVLAMLSVSLALLFPSINCKTTVIKMGGKFEQPGPCALFLDHLHPVLDYNEFSPFVEAQAGEHHIGWDEEALSPASITIKPPCTCWPDDKRGKSALVDINNTFPRKYTRYDWTSHRAKIAMSDNDLIRLRSKGAFNSIVTNLSYDELVEAVLATQLLKSLGDRALIKALNYQTVEFTIPYHESRVIMVVNEKPNKLNKFWGFLSPFTREMWLIVVALGLYNGLVIWIIECENEDRPNLLEALLFLVLRESPRSRLAYIVVVPWLLLVLLLTSTYTATFTSMLTTSPTDPSCFNVGNLKITAATVGCDTSSSRIFNYLVQVIGLNRKNIKNIAQSSIDEYAKALSTGSIEAAFFTTSHANAFLAKYPTGFRAWEPIPNLQYSAFVFPRGSPFAAEMSQLKQMQGVSLSFPDCSSSTFDSSSVHGVGPGPFSSMFIISFGASAIAMLITLIRLVKARWENCIMRMLMDRGLWAWLTTLFSQTQNQYWRTELQLQLSTITST